MSLAATPARELMERLMTVSGSDCTTDVGKSEQVAGSRVVHAVLTPARWPCCAWPSVAREYRPAEASDGLDHQTTRSFGARIESSRTGRANP